MAPSVSFFLDGKLLQDVAVQVYIPLLPLLEAPSDEDCFFVIPLRLYRDRAGSEAWESMRRQMLERRLKTRYHVAFRDINRYRPPAGRRIPDEALAPAEAFSQDPLLPLFSPEEAARAFAWLLQCPITVAAFDNELLLSAE